MTGRDATGSGVPGSGVTGSAAGADAVGRGADGAGVVDVAVVGGGPAGVAAAVTAAEAGARVVLVDGAQRLGGQFYRRPPTGPASHPWRPFDRLEARLAAAVTAGRVRVLAGTTVWAVDGTAGAGPFRLHLRGGDRDPVTPVSAVAARTVVVATGAHDRHLPFPGWDLPGVTAGGAAQALVKGSGVLPGKAVVVAGTGPFLLAVAATVLAAGGRVVAVVEANDPRRLLAHPAALLGAAGKAGEAARFAALLARHRVPYLARHRVLRADGVAAVTGVVVARVDADGRPRPGTQRRLDCDTVAIGHGFTAQTDLLLQLGCPARTAADGGLAVVVDTLQRTGVPGVFAAGETTGVGGADLALVEGLVAGAAAAARTGHATRLPARDLIRWQRRAVRLRRFADALHATFPVPVPWSAGLDDATTVCRCEEVDAGTIRAAVADLGAGDPRTVKLLTRAGMGWCQGRICGFAVDRLCAPAGTTSTQDQVRAAGRPLAVPVGLGALAALDQDPEPDQDTDPDGSDPDRPDGPDPDRDTIAGPPAREDSVLDRPDPDRSAADQEGSSR